MDSTKALKITIIAQWFFIFSSAVVSMYEESFLPVALQEYLNAEVEQDLTSLESIGFSISFLLVMLALFTSVAIYRLRPWARTPYTIIMLIIVFSYLFIGPNIVPPISAGLEYFADLAIGFTLSLLYYSQVSSAFEKTYNK